jgi:dimethylhistidine N-methyltransferase
MPLHDFAPETEQFRSDVLCGLAKPQKSIPCKYFYDERGSQLFDVICELDEYYPTRTEAGIMRQHGAAMAKKIGPHVALIEYGSGSSTKTRILLDHLREPSAYVPIDISREHLGKSAQALSEEYPRIPILPVCADYTRPFDLPDAALQTQRAVYFPGSTIGNFTPSEAQSFLKNIASVCGPGGGLLIGVDLQKETRILEAAYNDALGVTAEFNLNLLRRINSELEGDFQVDKWRHYAVYNTTEGRIEMHLLSCEAQIAHVGDATIRFHAGETICTEYSYKYTPAGFARLAAQAGLRVEQIWTDEQNLFSAQYLTAC